VVNKHLIGIASDGDILKYFGIAEGGLIAERRMEKEGEISSISANCRGDLLAIAQGPTIVIFGNEEAVQTLKLSPSLTKQGTRSRKMNQTHKGKVASVIYTHKGDGIVTLGMDATIFMWKWGRLVTFEGTPPIMAKAVTIPQPPPKEETRPSLAITSNDCYVLGCCGDRISLFKELRAVGKNPPELKEMGTFYGRVPSKETPPGIPTALTIAKHDNNFLAVALQVSNKSPSSFFFFIYFSLLLSSSFVLGRKNRT
jgi:hypothetical protein